MKEQDDGKRGGTEQIGTKSSATIASGCVLYVAESPVVEEMGTSYRFGAGEMLIGSAPHADFVLTDTAISAEHLRLRLEPEGIEIKDLESTNGTFYQGQQLSKARITSGVRIVLGRTKIDLIPFDSFSDSEIEVSDSYGELVGTSKAMRRLYTCLRRLESSRAPVLIHGETGTGKELIARAIHANSDRGGKPFVVVNCGGISPQLAESELFGHVKGSFTGAHQDRDGAFAQAEGGTLFLDEVGELPLDMQPALLRTLESGEVKRVGATTTTQVDVRIVAATHRDLRAMSQEGTFREDLFYRLAVIVLDSPPLRKRREDIPMLVNALASGLGAEGQAIPPAAWDFFGQYDWPGNVRELRNALQRVLALGDVAIMPADSAPQGLVEPASGQQLYEQKFSAARKEAIARFERAYIEHIWGQAEGNVSAAARDAGLDRKHLRDLLKKYGLYES